jgi:CBS domain-containing protein
MITVEKNIKEDFLTVRELNERHDEVMRGVVKDAIVSMESGYGLLPARFSFLLMGSAGRREQSILSDQDHALLHDGTEEDTKYFLELGRRITAGLTENGYSLCEGRVMASEPRWCRTVDSMKEQVLDWVREGTWEGVRHALILFDARPLTGSGQGIREIKEALFQLLREDPETRERILSNTSFRMRRKNIFGQILTDQHGYFDFKETVLFPYVNSARTGAVLEGITAVSTLERMEELGYTFPSMQPAAPSFQDALAFRHKKCRTKKFYEEVHLVHAPSLDRGEKRKVKEWMNEGSRLMENIHSYYRHLERKRQQ